MVPHERLVPEGDAANVTKTVYRLAHLAVPMFGVHRILWSIPLVGKPMSVVMKYALPMSFHPDPRIRVLDTLDWYSPWHQSEHTYEEVLRWFEDCGLKELRVILQPIAVQGQRPLQSEVKEEKPNQ